MKRDALSGDSWVDIDGGVSMVLVLVFSAQVKEDEGDGGWIDG